MSKTHDICRNPKCFTRFPKGNKLNSRPLPVGLVNVAAIDAYYAENPDKARHRLPAHVCVNCHKHVTFPTWQRDHLHRYVAPALPISSFF
jgi:hypothetical protein